MSTELAARLAAVPTADAKQIMVGLGVSRTVVRGMVRRTAGQKPFCGPARTVRFLPLREDLGRTPNGPLNRGLIDTIGAGEVLVLAADAQPDGALLGDMMAARLKARGAAGVVIDGAVRDVAGIDGIGLPVVSAAVHPDPLWFYVMPWAVDEPVALGGVTVRPGDFILSDADSTLVVPAALAAQVCDLFAAQKVKDDYSQHLLLGGAGIDDAYPLPKAREDEAKAFAARKT